MTALITVVFVVSSLLIIWNLAGYPLFLALAAAVRGIDEDRVEWDPLPRVTVIIPAYNEESVIGGRLSNILETKYPRDSLEVIVVSDASDDGTDSIVTTFEDEGVRLIRQAREGKVAGLGKAVRAASGRVIVISDANTRFEPETIPELVSPLADPEIGCSCGDLVLTARTSSAASVGETTYWSYETWIKKNASRVGLLLMGAGGVYAFRKEEWPDDLPPDLADDSFVPLRCALLGKRNIFVPGARAFEYAGIGVGEEFRRRVRMVSQDARVVLLLRFCLARPTIAAALFSQKILRWMLGLLGIAALASSLLLPDIFHAVSGAVSAGAAVFVMMIAAGGIGDALGIPLPILSPLFYLAAAQTAATIGLFRGLAGVSDAVWTQAPSTRLEVSPAPESSLPDGKTLPGGNWRLEPWLVGLLSFIVYLVFLSPSIGWGDGALYQANARNLVLVPSALGHPLHALLGRLFTLIPIGDIAWRVNLLSAVAAAATVGVLFRGMETLGAGRAASWAGAAALTFSHTFFLHAEIAEVYTLSAFFTAIFLVEIIEYSLTSEISRLDMAAFATGLGATVHPLAVVHLPGLFIAIMASRERMRPLLRTIFFGLLGSSLYIFLLVEKGGGLAPSAGGEFAPAIFGSISTLIFSLIRFPALFLYQYPILGALLAVFGLAAFTRRYRATTYILISVFLTNLLLAAGYGVKDQFVFYMPINLIGALWIALGANEILERMGTSPPPSAVPALIIGLVLLPTITYLVAPRIIESGAFSIEFAHVEEERPFPLVRSTEARNDLYYFLLPPKRNSSARPFVESVADSIPSRALVISDWTLMTPFLYLQRVEGRLRDVEFVEIPPEEQVEACDEAIREGRRVFITGIEPAYYAVLEMGERWEIRPFGPIYEIAVPPAEGLAPSTEGLVLSAEGLAPSTEGTVPSTNESRPGSDGPRPTLGVSEEEPDD